jgi:hypothetical protein
VDRGERKQLEQQQRSQEQAAQAWWASPVGVATAAKQNCDAFFQIEIAHETLRARNAFFARPELTPTSNRHPGSTDMLGQIEAIGWRLEHVNFVWIQTGEQSRDRGLGFQGSTTSISGRVVGIYLFRAV